MAVFKQLKSMDDLRVAWQKSDDQPVVLFKHSATCPISANAYEEVEGYSQSASGDADFYYVVVSENRDISNQIAEDTGVKHESPQIFLLSGKEVSWHTSHSDITGDNIKEALQA